MSIVSGVSVSVLWMKPVPTWWPGTVTKIGTTYYHVSYSDGEISKHLVSRWGKDSGVRPNRRKRAAPTEVAPGGGCYAYKKPKDAHHKQVCREYLIGCVADRAAGKALVLDDQHLMFTRLLIGLGDWDVTTPNNDEGVVATMRAAGISRPVTAYIGEVIADRRRTDVYDFVWLDYCGQAGSPARAATPMWDIAQLFALNRLAPGATLAVTVCARCMDKAKPRDPKYINLCRVTQQVYHSASMAQRLVTQVGKTPYIYTDAGAQTMCFASFTVC